MLKHLYIKNYALIESLDIDFQRGFSVITGETGAGKSIILGALGLLCGQRSEARIIKTGEKKCCVEGIFLPENPSIRTLLTDNDIDFDENECIIRREVNENGKSRAFVNDTPVTLSLLKELSNYLIDIHSQHQNLLLGREDFMLELLNGAPPVKSLIPEYQKIFELWKTAQAELNKLKKNAQKENEERDYLQYQLSQLTDAALEEDEQTLLEQEAEILSNTEEIKEVLFKAHEVIGNDEQPLTLQLRNAANLLQKIEHFIPEAKEWSERVESIKIELDDIESEIAAAEEKVEYNPQRLQFVEERLDTIYSLEKKHGVESTAQLLEIQKDLSERLENIDNFDFLLEEKEKKTDALYAELMKIGSLLSKKRKEAAAAVEKGLTAQLKDLGMPFAKVEIRLEDKDMPAANGLDNLIFLFSANKNVPLQNVAQIASGGEIARLMLALKVQLSTNTNLPTVIFDEIDTGVSGTMAEKMALTMKKMSQNCQVICITHLPQIAALGELHYKVEKNESGTTANTTINLLSSDGRIAEIANMLSGEEMTEAAINNAKSLLNIH